MQETWDSGFCFVAIAPGSPLCNRIVEFKDLVRAIAGDQLYLNDPPHLTVFLANFQDRNRLLDGFRSLASSLCGFPIEVKGWHVFENDVLTGNYTLTLELSETTQVNLRRVQNATIDFLAELRDQERSASRYSKSWTRLEPHRQKSVLETGFPFTGQDWIPHLTIASIKPEHWLKVWAQLESKCVQGTYADSALKLYELVGMVPNPIAEYHI
jgi:2'-5' RNA ligase